MGLREDIDTTNALVDHGNKEQIEALNRVLDAAEKWDRDGYKAEMLDAKEWWAGLSYYEAQPYIAKRRLLEPLNDFILSAYRAAQEDKA